MTDYAGLPIIVVTEEFRQEVAAMDFSQMSDDQFMEWLLQRSIPPIGET